MSDGNEFSPVVRVSSRLSHQSKPAADPARAAGRLTPSSRRQTASPVSAAVNLVLRKDRRIAAQARTK
jgi:hypothetical protein